MLTAYAKACAESDQQKPAMPEVSPSKFSADTGGDPARVVWLWVGFGTPHAGAYGVNPGQSLRD